MYTPSLTDQQHSERFLYRPALDGLRAVAVLAVFFYHLGYGWLRGGFIGVDIFFVLSGYLITSLLLIECESTGRIDLPAFWLRRARRLLPALLLLLVAVTFWVVWAAAPFEWPMRRRDILWSLFYGANWHFIASGQAYFSQFAQASPLRHTWSLAIEEQFYLVWPLVVFAAAVWVRKARLAVTAVCLTAIASSALLEALLFNAGDPSRAYYGTDTRIFQPLAGALLATVGANQAPRWLTRMRPAVGMFGAAGLAAAFVFLSDSNRAYYFGLSVALTASCVATIWAVENSSPRILARALSFRPLCWIGQISYGLYLWHWPVILTITAAPGPLNFLPRSTGVNLTRILVTLAVSTASFYLLEQPLRRGRALWIGQSAPRFVGVSVAAIVAVAATALWMTRSASASPMVAASNVVEEVIAQCRDVRRTPCLRHQGRRGSPVVATIGDSLAVTLDPAFVDLARNHGWTYVMAAGLGCRISDITTSYQGKVRPLDLDCRASTPIRLRKLLTDWNPEVIVAFDRWEIMDAVGPDGEVAKTGTPANISMTEASLTETARYLTSRGASLAFIELPPVIMRSCGSEAGRNGPDCRPRVQNDHLHALYNALFRRVAGKVRGGTTISITAELCPAGTCTWDRDGMVYRFDGLHFTREASLWLAPAIYQQLVTAGVIPSSD